MAKCLTACRGGILDGAKEDAVPGKLLARKSQRRIKFWNLFLRIISLVYKLTHDDQFELMYSCNLADTLLPPPLTNITAELLLYVCGLRFRHN